MTLKLVAKSEACCEPEELLLRENSYGIGRLHDNDLSIQIDCVSGYHAELKRTTDGGYAIIDLHSSNGTFLNENRVTCPVRVKPGDHLKLGNVIIAVEEHIEVVLPPEDESFIGCYLSKVISLKDEFDFTSEESFCTFPIKPIRTQPAVGNVNEVLKHPVRMEDPDTGIAAQQIERVREAERAQQIERAREAERVQQIERAREAERVEQIERAREAERVQQIERAREAERVQQIERAREAERVQQIERVREAERVQQIERAREAERVQQIERAREAEQAETDLRERLEPASSEDFNSKVHGLTAELETAMREIKRLKASKANESPRTAGMNSHAAPPANPSQPVASRPEDHAIQRSGNHHVRDQLARPPLLNPTVPDHLIAEAQSPSRAVNDPKPRGDDPRR